MYPYEEEQHVSQQLLSSLVGLFGSYSRFATRGHLHEYAQLTAREKWASKTRNLHDMPAAPST